MRAAITVVGLGPAGADLVAPGARALLSRSRSAFLRTSRHPAAAEFTGIPTFDHHYEAAARFEEVYERIVVDLVAAAQDAATDDEAVVYGVPGSPLVAERTVELLRADPRVDVTVVPGMSFLDLVWARLAVDPVSAGVRLVDGTRFAEEAAGARGPLLVAQCWSADVLSEVKLVIGDSEPPPESRVTVLAHLGLPDEVVMTRPWDELDRAVVADHLTTVWIPRLAAPVAGELAALDTLVRRLRRDCPWDREQTHASLRPHLLEEAYEVLEAIDGLSASGAGGAEARARAEAHLEEELGDLLFQIFFHSRLGAERGRFSVADVARGLHDKLVSRHPHVFGDVAARDAEAVVANWEEIKKEEKGRASVTEGIPAALPSLALSAKLQRKAAAVPSFVPEAETELRARATTLLSAFADGAPPAGQLPATDEERAGELLWAVADLVRRAGVEPEDALRAAAERHRAALVEDERRGGAPLDA